MRQFISIFFLLLYSTISAQTDSIGNYTENDFPDFNYEIDITRSKNFLFSDSLFRYPNYQTLPISVSSIKKNKLSGIYHTCADAKNNERLNIYQIGHSETFLFYQVGSANSQNLYLKHLQKINSNLSAQAEYFRNKSDGFYNRQNGKYEQVNFYVNFQNDFSYTFQPYFHYENRSNQENGGLKSDSSFQSGNFASPLFLETNLSSASNSKMLVQAGLYQKVVSKSKLIRFYSDIGYIQQKRTFEYDPVDSFYTNFFFDSTITNDLYRTERIYNEAKIFFLIKNFINRAGIKNEYLIYKQNSFDTTSFENKLFLKTEAYHWKNISGHFYFEYIFSGFNTGNYFTEVKLQKNNSVIFSKINFQSNLYQQTPDLFYFRMNGNNFQWENQLGKTTYFKNELSAESKIGDVKLFYEMINYFVYLDENREVKQTDESIQRVEIKYDYILEKRKFYWRNDLIFQKVFSGESFYRVPELTVRTDFRIKTKLKAMEMQIGVIANYLTPFFANAYDPALGNFYLQSEIKTGNYPILDFFILSKIKTVDLKFTIAHFNSGLTGFNYYATPLYPIAPRAFYFALSWHLTD